MATDKYILPKTAILSPLTILDVSHGGGILTCPSSCMITSPTISRPSRALLPWRNPIVVNTIQYPWQMKAPGIQKHSSDRGNPNEWPVSSRSNLALARATSSLLSLYPPFSEVLILDHPPIDCLTVRQTCIYQRSRAADSMFIYYTWLTKKPLIKGWSSRYASNIDVNGSSRRLRTLPVACYRRGSP